MGFRGKHGMTQITVIAGLTRNPLSNPLNILGHGIPHQVRNDEIQDGYILKIIYLFLSTFLCAKLSIIVINLLHFVTMRCCSARGGSGIIIFLRCDGP